MGRAARAWRVHFLVWRAILSLLLCSAAACAREAAETPEALLGLLADAPCPLEALQQELQAARAATVLSRLIAHHLAQTEAKTQIRSAQAAGAQAKVIAINDGLSDDSVRAERYELELARQPDGSWLLSRARRSWRCWPSRGHASFSAVPCS
jgi:hypothetical protein